jgi:hypothetical protein
MDIMDHQPTTDTPDLHMVTPLRPTGIGILITDHAHIPATGTVVIMVEGDMLIAVMDIIGKENALLGWHCHKLNYISHRLGRRQMRARVDLPEKGALAQDSFGVM